MINGATNTVIDTIGVGPSPIGISFDSNNGYLYVANGKYSESGSISIIATPTTTPLSEYTVTFKESGLPSGTAWYVNLSNGMKSGAVTGSSYSFTLTNGSYTYQPQIRYTNHYHSQDQ